VPEARKRDDQQPLTARRGAFVLTTLVGGITDPRQAARGTDERLG